MSTRKVLHMIPDSVVVTRENYLGSTKDIRGRTEYFLTRGIPFDELVVEHRSDKYLLEKFKSTDLGQYGTLFFELALYPESMTYVRNCFPDIKLITRSINADFYHWLHHFWVSHKNSANRYSKKSLEYNSQYIKNAVNRLKLDIICARLSDTILPIVDWEKEYYWKFLIPSKKIQTLPYFLPHVYDIEMLDGPKKDQCVCLMSTAVGTSPLLHDALLNFNKLVEKLGTRCPKWAFIVTGDLSNQRIEFPNRVGCTGFLETPFPLLVESRAMALLSNYGFGFKTKLIDAVQAGCYALVPKKLYNRLPEEIKPFCIVVKLGSRRSFESGLEKCAQPFPPGHLNARLKERAFSVLDELILDR